MRGGSRFRALVFLLALAFAVTALCAGPASAVAVDVVFTDSTLEAVVRTTLAIPAPVPITETDMLGLTSLEATGLGIASLHGLEPAYNLSVLEVGGNPISWLKPITGLTSLTRLDLESCQVADLGYLSGLTNLTDLDLGGNSISSLTPLSGLTNLTSLDLSRNSISSLGALSGLTALTTLDLTGNNISAIDSLSTLTSLASLGLGQNQIAILGPLSGITSLRDLYLDHNKIRDLTPLASLTNLEVLQLSDNAIFVVTPLAANSGIDSGDVVFVHNNYLDLAVGSQATSDVATLSDRGVGITYQPQWTRPVAHDISVTTTASVVVTITMVGTGGNGGMTYDILTSVVNGWLGIDAGIPDKVSYAPPVGFSGQESFTYRVLDGQLSSNTATVTVTVIPFDHTISATATLGGRIAPSGDTTVANTANRSYAITPDPGYQVTQVLVDGDRVPIAASGGTYTFTNVTEDHTIAVTFDHAPLTITSNHYAGGTITPDGAISVPYGGSQSFEITPTSGWYVDYVLVDGVSIGATTTYEFTNVTTNHTISPRFAAVPSIYTVNALAGPGGSISPSGDTTVSSGGSVTYTLTPDPGYQVNNLRIGMTLVGPVTSYTVSNVTHDTAVRATFERIPGVITSWAGHNGTISPSGNTTVTYGGHQDYAIAPDPGYRTDDVLVDGVSVGVVRSYTFNSVVASHSIGAYFTLNHAPVASNGSVTTQRDVPVQITLSATDSDGDSLGYPGEVGPAHGYLGVMSGNRVTFTPDAGYVGSDVCTFRAWDGLAYSNIATVSIIVNAPGALPQAPVPPGSDVPVTVGPVTVSFPAVSSAGTMTVTAHSPDNPRPSGFSLLPDLYFDIHAANVGSGPYTITVCVPASYAGDLTALRVFHWTSSGVETIIPTANVAARTLTFQTSSFSDFGVGEPAEDVPPGPGAVSTPASSWWSLAAASMLGIAAAMWSRRRSLMAS